MCSFQSYYVSKCQEFLKGETFMSRKQRILSNGLITAAAARAAKRFVNVKQRLPIFSNGFISAAAACATTIGLGANAALAATGTYQTNNTQTSDINSTDSHTAAYQGEWVSSEGASGNASYFQYAVIDVNTSTLNFNAGNNFAAGGVTGLSLTLNNYNETWETNGPLNFFVTTNTNSITSSQSYIAGGAYGGLGGNFGTLTGNANGTLYSLGTEAYTLSDVTGTTTYSFGSLDSSGDTPFSGALSTYLANQVDDFSDVRVLVTPGATTVASGFDGSSETAKPIVALSGTTASIPQTDGVLAVSPVGGDISSGSGTSASPYVINLGRIVAGTNATKTITLSTSSPDNASDQYFISSTGYNANANNLTATGIPTSDGGFIGGTNASSIALTVGINAPASEIPVASAAYQTYTSSTITINNTSNPSNTNPSGGPANPINITAESDTLVANRIVDPVSSTGDATIVAASSAHAAFIDYGNILAPATGTNSFASVITLTTDNNTRGQSLPNYRYLYTTTLELPGTTSLTNQKFTSSPAGDTSTATISVAGGTSTQFGGLPSGGLHPVNDSGTETAVIDMSYNLPSTDVGGSYLTADAGSYYYIGYIDLPLTQLDTALGATASPYSAIEVVANVYQSASVSVSGVSLANAPHTTNTILGADVGLRDAAVVTNPGSLNGAATNNGTGSTPFSIDAGFTTNATIGDGASLTMVDFNSTNLLDGTYQAEVSGVGLENDPTGLNSNAVQGAAPDDLSGGGNNNSYIATQTVTTNFGSNTVGGVGANTANVAALYAGESYNGFSITRASGNNSLQTAVQFLGGTVSAATKLSVTFGDTPANPDIVSDVAAISGTNSDTYVLELSYVSSLVNNGKLSPVLAVYNSTADLFQSAVLLNTGGTAKEVAGGFTNLTNDPLGSYGVNPGSDTVWAVLNYSAGDVFGVYSRIPGDLTGGGTVTPSDLGLVQTNLFGTTGGLWSNGDFQGTGLPTDTVTPGDLALVQTNLFATEPPTGSSEGAGGGLITSSPVPEPGSLALLAIGAGLPLVRRKVRRA
jgi:PEP-CTERM motif